MAKNWKETKRKNVNISAIIPNLGSILLFLGGGEGGEIISYFHLILSARWNKTRSWSGYLQTMHKAVSLFKFSWCLKSIYFNCTISIFLPIYFLLYFSFGDTSRNATLKSGLQKRHEYDDDDFGQNVVFHFSVKIYSFPVGVFASFSGLIQTFCADQIIKICCLFEGHKQY